MATVFSVVSKRQYRVKQMVFTNALMALMYPDWMFFRIFRWFELHRVQPQQQIPWDDSSEVYNDWGALMWVSTISQAAESSTKKTTGVVPFGIFKQSNLKLHQDASSWCAKSSHLNPCWAIQNSQCCATVEHLVDHCKPQRRSN